MITFAHRANSEGINRTAENSLSAVRCCLERGWSIETDIRRDEKGRFYISHDRVPVSRENQADLFCSLFRDYPNATIALNIKELGYEEALIDYLVEQRVLSQLFLFDMDLLEKKPGESARLFRKLNSQIRLAARVSDRNEPLERALDVESAGIIWLDEFDRLWVTEEDIREIKAAGKTVFAVSPEIHGFTPADLNPRWRDFYEWGVDGICTDYAAALSFQIQSEFKEVSPWR